MRCAMCKKLVDEKQMIVYNGKDICFCNQTCYTSFLSKEKEKEDHDFLYKEICRIFGINKLDEKLFAQIKRLKEKNGLSYKNITAVLHYMYDIQHLTIYTPTLYYVPDYIDKAKQYYQSLRERQAKTVKAIAEMKTMPTKTVRPNYNNKRVSRLKIDPSKV